MLVHVVLQRQSNKGKASSIEAVESPRHHHIHIHIHIHDMQQIV